MPLINPLIEFFFSLLQIKQQKSPISVWKKTAEVFFEAVYLGFDIDCTSELVLNDFPTEHEGNAAYRFEKVHILRHEMMDLMGTILKSCFQNGLPVQPFLPLMPAILTASHRNDICIAVSTPVGTTEKFRLLAVKPLPNVFTVNFYSFNGMDVVHIGNITVTNAKEKFSVDLPIVATTHPLENLTCLDQSELGCIVHATLFGKAASAAASAAAATDNNCENESIPDFDYLVASPNASIISELSFPEPLFERDPISPISTGSNWGQHVDLSVNSVELRKEQLKARVRPPIVPIMDRY